MHANYFGMKRANLVIGRRGEDTDVLDRVIFLILQLFDIRYGLDL
jgi:hypothetical protein